MTGKFEISGNRRRLLRVLGAAISLIVIALGARSAAASSPHPEFHNNVGFGGFCCAVLPAGNNAPNVIIVQTQPPAPPAPPRHTPDQHFTAETQNDVEIVRGPPSLR